MQISVRFVGGLSRASGREKLSLDLKDGIDLKAAFEKIILEFPKLEASLMNMELQDPRSNTLVFLNGNEISVLQGMETRLRDGDEITFIPVSHGG